MSEKPKVQSQQIPRVAYDLERRITNWIPIQAGIGVDGERKIPTLNDLAITPATYQSGFNAPACAGVGNALRFSTASLRMRSCTVLAAPGNAGNIRIGPTQPLFPLTPGAAYTYNGMELNELYYDGAVGDVAFCIAELV